MERLRQYITYFFWFCVAIIDIRIIEAIFSTYFVGDFWLHVKNNALGVCVDITNLCVASLIFAPIYWLLAKYFESKRDIVFYAISIVALYVGLGLVTFFAQAQFPLDRIIFLYSFEEIRETIVNSASAPWWMYAIVAAYPVAFFFVSKTTKIVFEKRGLVIIGVLASFCILVHLICFDKSAENQNYPEQCNKFEYLAKSTIEGFSEEEFNLDNVYKDEECFRSYFPNNHFVSQKCPFLHKKDTSNVLAPFFNLNSTTPPNIVILLVEGLARENSGKYSTFASATPFLDSLAEHSLIWLNCLSVSQKTFGVMPAVFGALPFGREGFMAYKKNAPDFYSVPKFLNENGYDFSFYYGGWAAFDDMNHFIDLQNGKQCFEKKFDSLAPRNNWGLLDKFMLSEAVKDIDFESSRPRLDVFLTLTSHDPWDYPDKDFYMRKYKALAQKQNKPTNQNVVATASYLYVDEAIRQLFHDYGKQKGFENTIFIITGDHNYNAGTYIIERYHVPLIIWSPMLEKAQEFPALVSHRDIPNSIISLLSDKYNMHTRDTVAWINGSLDTSCTFRSKTFIPQSDPSRNLVSMVYNDCFIYNNECYAIDYSDHALRLEKQTDKAIADSIAQLYEVYKNLDLYVCTYNALIDSSKISISRKELIRKSVRNFTDLYANSKKKDTAFTTNEFIDLVSLPMHASYTMINPDVTFECFAQDVVTQEPMLVIAVKDDQMQQVFWESYPIKMKQNEWITYTFNDVMTSLTNVCKDGYSMSLYIWNPAKVPFELTNLSVEVYDVR